MGLIQIIAAYWRKKPQWSSAMVTACWAFPQTLQSRMEPSVGLEPTT